MKRFLIPATIIGVALAALTMTGVTAQSTTAQPAPPEADVKHLETTPYIHLPKDTWVPVVKITLPHAGLYQVDADVRVALTGTPVVNSFVMARLTAAGAVVPKSERLIFQINGTRAGEERIGANQTAPISEVVRVSGRTDVFLQALRIDRAGPPDMARIYSDGHGWTSIRYALVS
jgi:hypothetical protein